MKLKASLKNRQDPQAIYHYLKSNVGKLDILIRRGYAIITFQRNQHYEVVLKEHAKIKIMGKLVVFKSYNEWEKLEDEDEMDEVYETQFMALENQNMYNRQSELESHLFKEKQALCGFMEEKFGDILKAVRQKASKLKEQFSDDEFKKREVITFEKNIVAKFQILSRKYRNGTTKVIDQIHNYNPSSIPINLCNSFQENELQPFNYINPDKFTFDCRKEYKNTEKYPVKRICALNGNQFMVTMKNRNNLNGFIKFYHVDEINCKQYFQSNQGCYGISCSNNVVFVGTYKNTISNINLKNEEPKLQSSNEILHGAIEKQCSIFDIKSHKKGQEVYLFTLGVDWYVKGWRVSNDEIIESVYSISNYNSLWQWQCEPKTLGFDVLNQNNFLIGSESTFQRVDLGKQKAYKEKINGQGTIYKIKTYNQKLIACAFSKQIIIFDIRTNKPAITFPKADKDIRALETIPQFNIVFGGEKMIGVADERKTSLIYNNFTTHKGTVTDISKINNHIISGDGSGGIYSWRFSASD